MAHDGVKIVTEALEATGAVGTPELALYTLVGGRVSMHQLPGGYRNEETAVLVKGQAMSRLQGPAVYEDRYAIECYGGSQGPAGALAVGQAVELVLHDNTSTFNSGGIMQASLETGTLFKDPDTRRWVYRATYRIRTTEV